MLLEKVSLPLRELLVGFGRRELCVVHKMLYIRYSWVAKLFPHLYNLYISYTYFNLLFSMWRCERAMGFWRHLPAIRWHPPQMFLHISLLSINCLAEVFSSFILCSFFFSFSILFYPEFRLESRKIVDEQLEIFILFATCSVSYTSVYTFTFFLIGAQ